MVTSVNEGMYTEMDSAGTPIQGIRDTNDFIHSGIIKGLSAGIRGHYAIKNGAYNGSVGFEIVQGNSGGKTTLAVAAGKVFRDGAYNSVATVTFTANSSPSTFDEPSSGTSYFMIVADASNVLKIRGDKANTNSLPVNKHTSSSATDILTGDVPIAIVKMANGGTVDARPIQFLTTDQDEKTVTIGHTTTNAFVEAMSISSTASVTTFENKVTDADIVFKVSDNGVSTEAMRIDGATANIGIGTNAPTELLHLSDADGTEPTILIENTGTNANEPELVFWRSTGTGADSRDIGHIKFKADDTAGNLHTFANIFADSEDADTTTEDGRLLFYVTKGGTDSVEQLRISGTNGIIFNEGGANIDVRIEGDTDANLIFSDASTDRVGIGTNLPEVKLHVKGTILAEDPVSDGSSDHILEVKSGSSSSADNARLLVSADTDLKLASVSIRDVEENSGNYSFNYSAGMHLDRASPVWTGAAQNDLLLQNGNVSKDIHFATNSGSAGDNATIKMSIDYSGKVGVVQTTPLSKLDVVGSNSRTITYETGASLTLGEHRFVVFNRGSAIAVTMPSIAEGRVYQCSNLGAGAVTFTRADSDVFYHMSGTSLTSIDINQGQMITLIGDESLNAWHVMRNDMS